MNIQDLVEKIKNEKIKWRGHASKRMLERSIKKEDVIHSVIHGEIIEQYAKDFPFPSCLIAGSTLLDEPLHTVCSIGQDNVWIITVYKPDRDKWKGNFKIRKEEK